jgi:hypothetical protein
MECIVVCNISQSITYYKLRSSSRALPERLKKSLEKKNPEIYYGSKHALRLKRRSHKYCGIRLYCHPQRYVVRIDFLYLESIINSDHRVLSEMKNCKHRIRTCIRWSQQHQAPSQAQM